MIVWEDLKVGGLIPLVAFLSANQGFTVTTRITAPREHLVDPRAVVSCSGADGEIHAWDHDDRHKTFTASYAKRHRSPQPGYREKVFREFFPDVSVEALPLVGGKWRAEIDASMDPSSGPIHSG